MLSIHKALGSISTAEEKKMEWVKEERKEKIKNRQNSQMQWFGEWFLVWIKKLEGTFGRYLKTLNDMLTIR